MYKHNLYIQSDTISAVQYNMMFQTALRVTGAEHESEF